MKISDYCTGCRLCEQVCHQKAIYMVQNDEGFLEPKIDEAKCIECKLCQKKCPQNNKQDTGHTRLAYAIRLKDDSLLKNSASGGAFIGFAKAFVLNGGYVAGVVYDNNWNAVYQLTNDLKGLIHMQSSKYLQADTGDIYSKIQKKLIEGKKVLFVGTACQVAGLKQFLNVPSENLVTIDIICHGVTSPLMFNKYIEWLQDKIKSKLLSYNFRSKNNGWGLFYTYTYTYTYKNKIKEVSKPMYMDPYYMAFLKGDAYRECCYRCKYSSVERISDVTIGDFWGIEKEHPSFYSSKGVSSVLINTQAGKDFFDTVKGDFYFLESEPPKIAKHNENLIRPTQRNCKIRDHFYDGIKTDDKWFWNIANKYRPSLVSYLKSFIPSGIRMYFHKLFLK